MPTRLTECHRGKVFDRGLAKQVDLSSWELLYPHWMCLIENCELLECYSFNSCLNAITTWTMCFACFLGLTERSLILLDLFSLAGAEMERVMEKPTWGHFWLGFWMYLTRHLLEVVYFGKVVVFWNLWCKIEYSAMEMTSCLYFDFHY